VGCDIHLAVERRNESGQWERVLPTEEARIPWLVEKADEGAKWAMRAVGVTWFDERNYELFAILAGVRNRFDIEPISLPRGLPDDLSDEARALDNYDGDDGDVYLGDHSQSWLTVKEILDYDSEQAVTISGYVSPEEFDKWRTNGRPSSYCQGVGGGGTQIISNEDMAYGIDGGAICPGGVATFASYYTKVEWQRKYREAAGSFFSRLLPSLVALGPPADTRIVFGFDN
jgi:hypothetical protein